MSVFHHGHVVQILWLIDGTYLQLFVIHGIYGLAIAFAGILVTSIYSYYVGKKKYKEADGRIR